MGLDRLGADRDSSWAGGRLGMSSERLSWVRLRRYRRDGFAGDIPSGGDGKAWDSCSANVSRIVTLLASACGVAGALLLSSNCGKSANLVDVGGSFYANRCVSAPTNLYSVTAAGSDEVAMGCSSCARKGDSLVALWL